METPSSDSAPLDIPSVRTEARALPRPLRRETTRLLELQVLPELVHRKDRRLAREVREVVRSGEPERLRELAERDRRTLLDVLDSALPPQMTRRSALAVVEMTALLGGVPEPGVTLSRWRTAPAR